MLEFRSDIVKILEDAKAQIQNNLDSEGVTTTGRTRNSLHVEDRGENIVLFQDVTGAPIETTQFGRIAGKVPYNFIGIIRQWIIDKKIRFDVLEYKRQPSERWQPKYTPVERGLLKRAGAIAHNIRTKGTMRNAAPIYSIYTQPLKDAVVKIQNIILGKIQAEIKIKN